MFICSLCFVTIGINASACVSSCFVAASVFSAVAIFDRSVLLLSLNSLAIALPAVFSL